MRVICVASNWEIVAGKLNEWPQYGDVDTVIACVRSMGLNCYALERFPKSLFSTDSFIPADETDSALDEVNKILETAFVNH